MSNNNYNYNNKRQYNGQNTNESSSNWRDEAKQHSNKQNFSKDGFQPKYNNKQNGQNGQNRNYNRYANNNNDFKNNQSNNEKQDHLANNQNPPQKDYRNFSGLIPPSFNQQKFESRNDNNKYSQMRKEQRKRNAKAISIQFATNMSIEGTKNMIITKLRNGEKDFEKIGMKIEPISNTEHILKCEKEPDSIHGIFQILFDLKKKEKNIYYVREYFEMFNEEKHKKSIEELRSKFEEYTNKHNVELQKTLELSKSSNVSADMKNTYREQSELLIKQKNVFDTFFQNLIEEYSKYLDINFRMKKEKDARIKYELNELEAEFKRECLKFEAKLPLYGYKKEILDDIINYQVFIIRAETGSGKSTQLPQYLTQLKELNKKIVCTQPRRIAAMSLAKQVAVEMLDRKVGYSVGYSIGQHARMRKKTKIMYMTDSKFLNEILDDRKLENYSTVIVDEAHERGVHSELLISMLRECLSQRKNDFKIFISSATITTDIFKEYFKDFKVKLFDIPGRLYPVELKYCPYLDEIEDEDNQNIDLYDIYEEDMFLDLPDFIQSISNKSIKNKQNQVSNDYLIPVVEKAISVAKETTEGDILVFLTGVSEIEEACIEFQNRLYEPDLYLVLQLHGSMNPDEQNDVFKEYENKNKQKLRKIIFSTNVAETSITLANVKYIIDSGKEKSMKYDPINEISILEVGSISKSSADQRKGRAGRTQPGVCYRMYSEKEYNKMKAIQTSEILRINLSKSILKLMDLQVKDPVNFDFIEKPEKENLVKAFEFLIKIGAIKSVNNPNNKYEAEITDVGRLIARLPFEPHLSLIVLNGINKNSKFLLECFVLAAVLSQSEIFYRACIEEEKDFTNACRLHFSDVHGDAFTLLRVFAYYLKEDPNVRDDWCRDYSLNFRTMRSVFNQIYEAITVYNKSPFGKNKNLKFASNIENDMNELGKTYEKPLEKVPGVYDEIKLGDDAKNELLEILFETFREKNLCHHTGVANLYYLSRLDEFIRIFPTQTYALTHKFPEYICFERILLTESKYLLGVQDITIFVKNYILISEMTKWKNSYSVIERKDLGGQVMRQLIGKGGSNLRKIEKEIFESYNVKCYAHADTFMNSFKIISKNGYVSLDSLKDFMDRKINNCIQIAQKKSVSIPLSSYNDAVAVIRTGGHIMDFLRFSNKTLLIKSSNKSEADENKIRSKFQSFGPIKTIVIINDNNKSLQQQDEIAILEYEESASVTKAISESARWNDYKAVSPRKNVQAQQSFMYETSLRLSWDRRNRKNYAFIEFDDNVNANQVALIANSGNLFIKDTHATLRKSNNNNLQIQIANLQPNLTSANIKEAIEQRFTVKVKDVKFGYDKGFTTTESDFKNTKIILNAYIENTKLVSRKQYEVTMAHPKDTYVRYDATIKLNLAPDELKQFCDSLLSSTPFPYLSIKYQMKIKINMAIYSVFAEEINKTLKELNIQIKSFTRDVMIELESFDLSQIENNRKKILNIIKFEQLDLSDKSQEFTNKLETKMFQRTVNRIIMDTKTFIEYDKFTKSIKVYGSNDNIKLGKEKLNNYLIALESKSVSTILLNHYLPAKIVFNKNLSNYQKVQIGIKWIFDKHSPNLRKLFKPKNENEMSSPQVAYDIVENLILFEGEKEDYDVLTAELGKMKADLENLVKDEPNSLLCCSNGLNCKLSNLTNDLQHMKLTYFKLSMCGHMICNLCFDSNFDKIEFPIKCSKCTEDNQIVAEDLIKLCNKQQLNELLWHGLNEFANGNPDKYYKCKNKQCLMIYENNKQMKITCQYCS